MIKKLLENFNNAIVGGKMLRIIAENREKV